ncbi:C39 family peptidase [Bacillus sp. FJAT-27445]|uniref:C39 family peptidase n=1 Tax=Bacillus sp. FJAT-27445 TaxID=1679166 RepID=UPI0007442C42|nr:C39 family peptidase [Bacillus sp. FJAT-27445]
MKKLITSTIIISSLLLPGIIANAAGTGDDPSLTEDIKTPEQERVFAEKEEATKPKFSTLSLPDGTYKVLSVPSYQQETSYWCGPATVKQVLQYLTGTSKTQSNYASELGTTRDGTDFTRIDDILNKYQNMNTYVYASIGDYASWTSKTNYGIQNNYPAVLDLKITSQYMPKYTTPVEGHILNVSGYDSRTSPVQMRLTDPFDQGGRGVTLGNVWHPHRGVYDANNAHFRQALQY